eukprot:Selendium_serpulae@DN3633_c1_g1_i2.p1
MVLSRVVEWAMFPGTTSSYSLSSFDELLLLPLTPAALRSQLSSNLAASSPSSDGGAPSDGPAGARVILQRNQSHRKSDIRRLLNEERRAEAECLSPPPAAAAAGQPCAAIADLLPCVLLSLPYGADYFIIFAHNNGNDIGEIFDRLVLLSRLIGAHIISFDYPGYGKHEGRADEVAVDWCLRVVFDFVHLQLRWPMSNFRNRLSSNKRRSTAKADEA